MADKLTRTQMKSKAQDELMYGIANVLGYCTESMESRGKSIPEDQQEEFRAIIQREADRIAKLFGFENAWSN